MKRLWGPQHGKRSACSWSEGRDIETCPCAGDHSGGERAGPRKYTMWCLPRATIARSKHCVSPNLSHQQSRTPMLPVCGPLPLCRGRKEMRHEEQRSMQSAYFAQLNRATRSGGSNRDLFGFFLTVVVPLPNSLCMRAHRPGGSPPSTPSPAAAPVDCVLTAGELASLVAENGGWGDESALDAISDRSAARPQRVCEGITSTGVYHSPLSLPFFASSEPTLGTMAEGQKALGLPYTSGGSVWRLQSNCTLTRLRRRIPQVRTGSAALRGARAGRRTCRGGMAPWSCCATITPGAPRLHGARPAGPTALSRIPGLCCLIDDVACASCLLCCPVFR